MSMALICDRIQIKITAISGSRLLTIKINDELLTCTEQVYIMEEENIDAILSHFKEDGEIHNKNIND